MTSELTDGFGALNGRPLAGRTPAPAIPTAAWKNVTGYGNFTIDASISSVVAASSNTQALISVGGGAQEVSFEFRPRSGANDFGLILRADINAQRYYRIVGRIASNEYRLERVVSGVVTTLNPQAVSFSTTGTYLLRARIYDLPDTRVLIGWWEEESLITYHIDSDPARLLDGAWTGLRHGAYVGAGGAFKNFTTKHLSIIDNYFAGGLAWTAPALL